MITRILVLISYFLSWNALVAVEASVLSITFAILVPLLTYWFASKFKLLPENNPFNIKIFPYIIWLLKEISLSSIGVIKIAWRRNLAILPVFDTIKTVQKSDVATSIYANSITLTPGTITIDVKGKNLLVHSLDLSIMEDLKTGAMDKKIAETIKE